MLLRPLARRGPSAPTLPPPGTRELGAVYTLEDSWPARGWKSRRARGRLLATLLARAPRLRPCAAGTHHPRLALGARVAPERPSSSAACPFTMRGAAAPEAREEAAFVARPKSYPERHLVNPSSARARLLKLLPEGDLLLVLARTQVALADYADYGAKCTAWKAKFDKLADRMRPPPRLPASTRSLVGAEPRFAFFVDRHEDLQRRFQAVRDMRSLPLPTRIPPRSRDKRLLMGASVLWAASALGVRVGPIHLVLLEVAVGSPDMAGPTTSATEYAERCDRWRKLMPRLRAQAQAFATAWGTFPGNASDHSAGT